MKIMQLNVWMNKLDKAICDLIEKEDPDIICMQEAISCEVNLGFMKSFEQMNHKLNYPHIYFSGAFALQFMHEKPKFGNLILSKIPFKATHTVFTNSEFCEDLDYINEPNSYNVRNFQHVEINYGENKLNIINHHGYHIPGHKKGNDITLHASQQIIDFVKKLDGQVIITGDLNIEPSSESIKYIENSGFINLPVNFNINSTRNYLTSRDEVCDYIFINDKVQLKEFYMSEFIASDHNALIAVID